MNLEDYLSMLQKMAEQQRKRQEKLRDDHDSTTDKHGSAPF
jgi:hypothetical protein